MVGVGCGSVALGASHGVVSMTFGLAVTCAILLFGSWSGAHINPAVTLAFWRDGQLESNKVGPYMLAQYSGAFLAAMAVQAAAPTTVQPHLHALEGFVIELVITALLMTSILLVVQRTSSRTLIAALGWRNGCAPCISRWSAHRSKHEPSKDLWAKCSRRNALQPTVLYFFNDARRMVCMRPQI